MWWAEDCIAITIHERITTTHMESYSEVLRGVGFRGVRFILAGISFMICYYYGIGAPSRHNAIKCFALV